MTARNNKFLVLANWEEVHVSGWILVEHYIIRDLVLLKSNIVIFFIITCGSPRAEQKKVATPPTLTLWLIGRLIISGGSDKKL